MMGYHFHRSESIEAGLRRIACMQLDAALSAISEGGANAPHEVRKRCKKLRGLLRLVRGAFVDFGAEQHVVREAARALAAARESSAHLEALHRLERAMPARLDDPDFIAARALLESALQDHVRSGALEQALAHATSVLAAQRERVPHWALERGGFGALESGLVAAYRNARRSVAAARRRPDAKRLHELRKWVKNHRYHLDLLHALWPGPFIAWVESAGQLGELLGQHHDIDVLLETLRNSPADGVDPGMCQRLADNVVGDADALKVEAFALAARLLAEKPSRFRARMLSYWQAWREAPA